MLQIIGKKTKSLLFKTLAIWAIFAFVIHWFGAALEQWFIPRQLFHGWHGVTARLCGSHFLVCH
jgi:hypothetical protein